VCGCGQQNKDGDWIKAHPAKVIWQSTAVFLISASTRSAGVDEKTRFQLHFGPYEPPPLRAGEWAECALSGRVLVGKWSEGMIPWPRRYRTRGLILCGDLVRAVRQESAQAVAWHWGVVPAVVQKWRRALKVPKRTLGTERVQLAWSREIQRHRRDPAAPSPRAIGHSRRKDRRRKPPSRAEMQSFERRGLFARAWTQKEEALLGTKSDREVARQIQRSLMAVRLRRNLLGIPACNPLNRAWTAEEYRQLGTMADRLLAKKLKRSPQAVTGRRELLHVPKFDPKLWPWTEKELALLGTMPDAKLARNLGRTEKAVQSKRVEQGKLRRKVRVWKPEEIALLGTKPDQAVARKLKRSVISVAGKRRLMRIQDFGGKSGGRDWMEKELALLGKIPDAEAARRTGRTLSSIKNRRFSLRRDRGKT